MKFIGKLLLTLLLLVVLAVALLYVIGQTRWAAGWVSRWVSDNSDYRLSVAAISHSWNQPGQISLEDVQLAKKINRKRWRPNGWTSASACAKLPNLVISIASRCVTAR